MPEYQRAANGGLPVRSRMQIKNLCALGRHVALTLLCGFLLNALSNDAAAQTSPNRAIRVAPVWRASLSTGPNTRPYFYATVQEAYSAYAAWVVTQVLPPVRVVVSPNNWPCSPQAGYYNGVPYAWCHHYERWYGPTLELSMTAGAVTNVPLCPEDYRMVYVVPPPGGSPFNVRVVCEAWTPLPPSQCPPDSCNALGNPIFPEDATKRQVEVDYQSPHGTLNFSRTFNSAYGGFFHSYQTPVRRAYDLGQLAATTQNPISGCLSSRVRIADGDGTIRYYPYCFTYVTDDGQEGRVDMRTSSGLLMQFSATGAALDSWNAGSQLLVRTVQGSSGRALVRPLTNSVDFYNTGWQLVERQYSDGRRLALSYNGAVVSSLTDEFGRRLTLNHDSDGRLVSMVDPAGGVFNYTQGGVPATCQGEGCQVIASVTYPDQRTRVYHWNEAANVSGPPYGFALLTGVTDELNQRFSTFKYLNRNAKSTERAGSTLLYQIGQLQPEYTIIIDPLGNSRTYRFSANGGLTSLWNVSSWCPSCAFQNAGYDANGNPTFKSDFKNNATCFAYDLTRNLEAKRVEGVVGSGNCSTALSSPPAGARLISTQWHPDWRLETRIAEPKKLTTITYNGQGATCAPSTVLVDGKPPAVICTRTEQATTDETGAAGFAATVTGTARTWRYTYTTYGRVLTATDPNNRVTSTSYHADNDADLGKRGNVASITNAANHTTFITDYNPHGQPTRIVDPNGVVTVLTYDPRMRLTSRTVGNEATVFGYDPVGQMTSVNLPDGARLTYTYDAAHRLTAINDHKGNRIDYTLDAMGNRITEKTKDPSGVLVGNIARVIDALNRVQQVTGAAQ